MNISTPIVAENPRAVAGNNRPPFSMELDLLPAHLATETVNLAKRRDELIDSFGRAPESINDEETAKKMADLGKAMTAYLKAVEADRTNAKEPFRQGGEMVDGHYKGALSDDVTKGLKAIKSRYDDYMARKEAERRRELEKVAREAREAEEAARMEADILASTANVDAATTAHDIAVEKSTQAHVAEKAALAKPAELSRVRSDLGTVASRTSRWTGEVTDREAIIKDVGKLLPYFTLDDLNKAVRAAVKAGMRPIKNADGSFTQPIAGARIYDTNSTSFR